MTWKYLKQNKASALPRHFVFLDCESHNVPVEDLENTTVQPLRLGVAIAVRYEKQKVVSREVFHFTKSESFWLWLETFLQPKITVWLVAHNLPYDLKTVRFFQRVEKGSYKFDLPLESEPDLESDTPKRRRREGLIVMEDAPTILSLNHRNGGKLIAVDTLNYWRMSLANMGKSVGIEKGKFPGFDGPDDELAKYCENDATIIEKSMIRLLQWWQKSDLGNFKFTSPSLAMTAYRHRFMKKNAITFHDETSVKQLERDSYTGGETEVYRYGTVCGHIHQLDVTSLYPAVMKEHLFPCRLVDWFDQGRPQNPPDRYPPKAMIARVELSTKSTYPLRHKDSTLHVSGSFVTTLAGPELHRAVQAGDVVRWENWAFYRLAPIFELYVEYFWNLRLRYQQEGDKMLETFVKLLLNSLYGKFGQLSPPWEYAPEIPSLKRWGRWPAICTQTKHNKVFLSLDNHVFRPVKREPSEKSSHAIASFVTAYAREFMRRLRGVAGDKQFYYQATDSLCVSDLGFRRLTDAGEIEPSTLGKLKVEHESDSGIFLGNNWYTLDDKIIEGGKKKEEGVAAGTSWEETHFQGFKQMLETTQREGVLVKTIRKERSVGFNRGVVSTDGFVRPFHSPGELP